MEDKGAAGDHGDGRMVGGLEASFSTARKDSDPEPRRLLEQSQDAPELGSKSRLSHPPKITNPKSSSQATITPNLGATSAEESILDQIPPAEMADDVPRAPETKDKAMSALDEIFSSERPSTTALEKNEAEVNRGLLASRLRNKYDN